MGAHLRRTLVLCALAALAGSAAGAKAADIQDSAAAPSASWSGFYIGAYAGGAAIVSSTELDQDSALFSVHGDADGNGGDGVLGGAMAGFNWQATERIVLGLQGDIAAYELDAGDSFRGFEFGPDFIASASLRAGYLVTPDTMLYVIGGYSHGEFEAQSNSDGVDLDDLTSDGFHLGAGMEARLTDRLSARIEYRYTEFGAEDPLTGEDPQLAPGSKVDVEAHTHTGTLGLAYNLFPTEGDGEAVSPAANVIEPMASWTGLYIGLSGGAGAFVADSLSDVFQDTTAGGEGFLGNVFAGYN